MHKKSHDNGRLLYNLKESSRIPISPVCIRELMRKEFCQGQEIRG